MLNKPDHREYIYKSIHKLYRILWHTFIIVQNKKDKFSFAKLEYSSGDIVYFIDKNTMSTIDFETCRYRPMYALQRTYASINYTIFWCRRWRVPCLAQSHYLNQCCLVVNWTSRNKRKRELKNTVIFIQEKALSHAQYQSFSLVANMLDK